VINLLSETPPQHECSIFFDSSSTLNRLVKLEPVNSISLIDCFVVVCCCLFLLPEILVTQ
jgi:hypothetical protein